MIAPLLIVLAVLIVCLVSAELHSPFSLFKSTTFWSETAIQLFTFLAIAQTYAMIMKALKRRWQTEAAAAEEPERQSD